jgi:hypothetical protein
MEWQALRHFHRDVVLTGRPGCLRCFGREQRKYGFPVGGATSARGAARAAPMNGGRYPLAERGARAEARWPVGGGRASESTVQEKPRTLKTTPRWAGSSLGVQAVSAQLSRENSRQLSAFSGQHHLKQFRPTLLILPTADCLMPPSPFPSSQKSSCQWPVVSGQLSFPSPQHLTPSPYSSRPLFVGDVSSTRIHPEPPQAGLGRTLPTLKIVGHNRNKAGSTEMKSSKDTASKTRSPTIK